MNQDLFLMHFSAGDSVAQQISKEAQMLFTTLHQWQVAYQHLVDSGLQGAFSDELEARNQQLQKQWHRMADEVAEIGRDLQTVVDKARQLDVECANAFDSSDLRALYNRWLTILNQCNPDIRFGLDGRPNNADLIKIDFGNFPDGMFPTQTDILRLYLGGYLPFWAADNLMKVASTDPVWRNLIDAEVNLLKSTRQIEGSVYETQLGDTTYRVLTGKLEETSQAKLDKDGFEQSLAYDVEGSVLQEAWQNEYAAIQVDLIKGELSGEAFSRVSGDGFEAGVKAEAGIYLAHAQGSAQWNGFQAAGDASVSAHVEGELKAVFDPKNGDVKVEGDFEAFAGAEAQGSIGYSTDFFSVDLQGAVAAGGGAKGHFDIGYDEGIFTLDASFLASVGIGGGGGVKVNINAEKIAESIITSDIAHEGQKIVEDFGDNVESFLDSIF